MVRINGLEIVDSYDVYTVTCTIAGSPVPVLCDDEEEALQLHSRTGGAVTVSTHYVTESRKFIPEVDLVQ